MKRYMILAALILACTACGPNVTTSADNPGAFRCTLDGRETEAVAVAHAYLSKYSSGTWDITLPSGQDVSYTQRPGEWCAVMPGTAPL